MKRTQQWEKQAKKGKEVQKTTPVMLKGSDMHTMKGNDPNSKAFKTIAPYSSLKSPVSRFSMFLSAVKVLKEQ